MIQDSDLQSKEEQSRLELVQDVLAHLQKWRQIEMDRTETHPQPFHLFTERALMTFSIRRLRRFLLFLKREIKRLSS